MSLIKKQSMTEKNRGAHRRNGRQSRGAATPAGKERSRAASLRHGFYSRERAEALRALGEDPAELDALIEATLEEWRPPNAFQARLAERLARLLWRMERAERMQESLAARQMQEHEERRQDRALQVRYKVVPRMDILAILMEGVVDPRYYTPRGYFGLFCDAFGNKVEGVEKEILELMHRLRKPPGLADEPRNVAASPESRIPSPDAGPSGARPGRTPSAPTEEARPGGDAVAQSLGFDPSLESRIPSPDSMGGATEEPSEDPYLADLAEMDEDDFPIPWPKIPVAEGAERDELREELRHLAKNLLEIVHGAVDPELEELEAPLSRLDQDEAQAAPHRHAELMQREEMSCFRQFVRLGNFLMKLQDHAAKRAENEGPPGYIDENTERGQTDPTADCPEPVAVGTEDARQKVRSPGSEVRGLAAEARGRSSEARSAGSRDAAQAEGQQIVRSRRSDVRSPRLEVRSPGHSEPGGAVGKQTAQSPRSEVRSSGSSEVPRRARISV